MTIKELKIGNIVHSNMPIVKDDVWNVPEELEDFKQIAIDTVNWKIGKNVKKSTGNLTNNMSASNAKAIVLLTKIVNAIGFDDSILTELEKSAFDKMTTLADNGYADSNMLVASITSVSENIEIGTQKVVDITNAGSHEAVVEVLNR
jgi:hypothetical protein